MSTVPEVVHGGVYVEQRMQEMRNGPLASTSAGTVGWKCPGCFINYAPTVTQCTCSARRILVPRHVIVSIEEDVARTKRELVPGTRIPRGSFVLTYIERVLEVVKNEKVK